MGMGISKAYYKDNVTAFILLSSDSDFWGVISSLPDADFLVMVEEEKCGPDIQNALEQDGTYYCFMDDFCTGNIKTFKNAMFISALKDEMGKALAVDTHALIDDIITTILSEIYEWTCLLPKRVISITNTYAKCGLKLMITAY